MTSQEDSVGRQRQANKAYRTSVTEERSVEVEIR